MMAASQFASLKSCDHLSASPFTSSRAGAGIAQWGDAAGEGWAPSVGWTPRRMGSESQSPAKVKKHLRWSQKFKRAGSASPRCFCQLSGTADIQGKHKLGGGSAYWPSLVLFFAIFAQLFIIFSFPPMGIPPAHLYINQLILPLENRLQSLSECWR